jgi:uncharacterized protein YqgV (UPF0045/DUF77 family)
VKITVDVRVVPSVIGQGGTDELGAQNRKKFEDAGLTTYVHAMGINVQGDATTIFKTLRDILSDLHNSGVPRVSSSITIESNSEAPASIDAKLALAARAG